MIKKVIKKTSEKNMCPIIMLIFLALMIVMLSLKVNYEIDETCSYTFANNVESGTIVFEDGIKYDSPSAVFLKSMTVDPSERFHYSSVWTNQANDVHPPLYHAFLHTICSLFPGTMSRWYAGSINIICSLAVLILVYKLIELLTSSRILANLLSLVYVFLSGVLLPNAFLRMYIMAMLWVTLISYLFVKEIGNERSGWKFYISIFAASVAGALTHYYCIVFTVGISVVYGCCLLAGRRWKDLYKFCGTMLAAGGMSYLIFPAMVKHMFFGGRGSEAIDNLSNLSDYGERLNSFFTRINNSLFGGSIGYLLFILIVGILYLFIYKNWNMALFGDKLKRNKGAYNKIIMRYMVLIIPTLLFFGIVSKMAAYEIERYMSPIYGVVYVWVICLIFEAFSMVFARKLLNQKQFWLAMCVILFVITVGSWKNHGTVYFHRESSDLLEKAANYSELDCICIYDRAYEVQPCFLEASNYKSITFVKKDEIDTIFQLEAFTGKEIIVVAVEEFAEDKERYARQIVEGCPSLKGYEELGSFAYSTSYHLY